MSHDEYPYEHGRPEHPGDRQERRTGRPGGRTKAGAKGPVRTRRDGRGDGRRDGRTGGRGPARGRDRAKGGTAPPGSGYRRVLRRESPTLVGMILTGEDFTAMTRYPGFPFRDYGRYLHDLDGLLRSLHAQGRPVAVTHFDPEEYADYCATTRRPPGDAATRTRYVIEVTASRTAVPYTRQPLPVLRTEVARAADSRATWEHATDLLLEGGPCPECGRDLAHCAFDRASQTLLRLVEALGPGAHHVVCSLPSDDGPPLLAAAHIDAGADGHLRLAETDALVLCTVIAAGAAGVRPGGLVVRTTGPDGTDTVRGWTLRRGEPHPLTEAEVFDAYCTDVLTGEPVPPEPGVRYCAGVPLPPPPPEEGPAG